MRAAAGRLRQHLGRRGIFLLIIGAGKVCWGASFIVEPPEQSPGLDLLTDLCSLRHWAWLWIGAGLITAACAFVRIGRDWLGFCAALVPPTVWALAYTMGALSGDYARGGWIAVWYLTSHVGVIMWAATVPEYAVPPQPHVEEGETA